MGPWYRSYLFSQEYCQCHSSATTIVIDADPLKWKRSPLERVETRPAECLQCLLHGHGNVLTASLLVALRTPSVNGVWEDAEAPCTPSVNGVWEDAEAPCHVMQPIIVHGGIVQHLCLVAR